MIDHKIISEKVVIRTKGRLCDTAAEVIHSDLFRDVISSGIQRLRDKNSPNLKTLQLEKTQQQVDTLIEVLELLARNHIDIVRQIKPDAGALLDHPDVLNSLLEFFYNYWREYERYIICDSQYLDLENRPYRTFHDTVERLAHLVRKIYRDISENILSSHPKTYWQVNSGAEFACISSPLDPFFTEDSAYQKLRDIPVIHQLMMNPPLILNTTMNKRRGQFKQTKTNPLDLVDLKSDE